MRATCWHAGWVARTGAMVYPPPMQPLTDAELWELEAEARAVAAYALDEADVRLVQLRQRAYVELRELRAETLELRERARIQKEQLDNANAQLALTRKR